MSAGPCEPTPLAEAPRQAESFESKREREREKPPEAALQAASGEEDGWGTGGWFGGVKSTGGFCHKIPVPNVIFRSFFFLGSDSVATLLKGLKSIPHRIRFAKHIKTL